MFALPILFASTLLEEISETLGKRVVRLGRETVWNLAFLSLFWALIFLIIAAVLGVPFVVEPAAIPFLAVRIPVECALGYVAALAVVRADRSTLCFLRLLTIPLVLITDIALGYHLTAMQLIGVVVIFTGLVFAFHHNPAGRRGARLAILVAILSAASATLFKWDITHYNSIAGEQITVYFFTVLFFYFGSLSKGSSPLKLLLRRHTAIQSLAFGLGIAVEAFAFGFAPASVIVAFKRSLAVMWSIIFGRHYFKETRVRRKLVAGAVLATGLVLMVLN